MIYLTKQAPSCWTAVPLPVSHPCEHFCVEQLHEDEAFVFGIPSLRLDQGPAHDSPPPAFVDKVLGDVVLPTPLRAVRGSLNVAAAEWKLKQSLQT